MPYLPDNIYQDQEKKYQWRTRGENCPYCDAMEGRIYTLDVLMTSSVYPGFHKGCNCYLVEVPQETPMSDLDIFGTAFSMRNNSWLNILLGRWDDLWLPGYYTNAQAIFANAKPGMTAGEALKLANKKRNYGMFKDYGFPGNILYSWNVFRNVNKKNFIPGPDLLKDVYTGFKQLQSGEYLATVITSKTGMFLSPPKLKPQSPIQTYQNKLYPLGGR
jgi:hypothetical protein